MKASKINKKIRWLQKQASDSRRAKIIRNMSRAKIEKLRRKHG